MTADQRLERDLPEILAQLAPRVTPDYRDQVVQTTAALTQRPAWMFPARWLPIDDDGRGVWRSRSLALVATVAVVGLLVLALGAAYVGSRRPPLPAPFGPALDGGLYYVQAGDIYRFDPTDGTAAMVQGDPAADSRVVPSRDGTRLALLRPAGAGTQVVVTDADGRNARRLDGGSFSELEGLDWSPDGRAVITTAMTNGRRAGWILPVDGSTARRLDVDMAVADPWYLPDGRVHFEGTTSTDTGASSALYLIDPDGGVPTALTSPTLQDLDIIAARPSPDGTKVVYHRWREPDQKGRIRVIDLATKRDTPLAVSYPDEEFADENAQFSPGGQDVLFTRYLAAGNQLVIVPATGGAPRPIGRVSPGNDAPAAAFSPDGRSVLARYADGELWQLDATGTGVDRKLDLQVADLPAWQRSGE